MIEQINGIHQSVHTAIVVEVRAVQTRGRLSHLKTKLKQEDGVGDGSEASVGVCIAPPKLPGKLICADIHDSSDDPRVAVKVFRRQSPVET